jgi:hypothetical protein
MKLLQVVQTDVHGITEEWWLRQDGKITVRRMQDVDPFLDANRQQMGAHSSKGRRDYGEGLGEHVARIPNALIEQLIQTHGVNLATCDEKTLKRFLNSSEYAKLRTAPGRI